MSIRDLLAAERDGKRSSIETWLTTLDSEDRAAIIEAAGDDNLSTNALHRIIKSEGAQVGKDAMLTWRKANGFSR